MPNTFNFLVCMLALLIGILIGEKYRKWKKGRDEKKDRDEKKGSDEKKDSTEKKDNKK